MYENLSAAELDQLAMQGRISVADYWRARIALDEREQSSGPDHRGHPPTPQPPAAFPLPPGQPPVAAQPAHFVPPPPPSAPPGAGRWVRLGSEAPSLDAAATRADDSLGKRRFRRRRRG